MARATLNSDAADLRRRAARVRRGISLIETAAAMAATAVLFGVTIVALIAVQRADRLWREREREWRSREQLLDQLRLDLHAAQDFAWDSDNASLQLTMAGGQKLVYRRAPGRWERRQISVADATAEDAHATAGALASAFRTPASTTWQVTPVQGEVGDLVHIRLVHSAPEPDAAAAAAASEPSPFEELVVMVGRNWRLLHP